MPDRAPAAAAACVRPVLPVEDVAPGVALQLRAGLADEAPDVRAGALPEGEAGRGQGRRGRVDPGQVGSRSGLAAGHPERRGGVEAQDVDDLDPAVVEGDPQEEGAGGLERVEFGPEQAHTLAGEVNSVDRLQDRLPVPVEHLQRREGGAVWIRGGHRGPAQDDDQRRPGDAHAQGRHVPDAGQGRAGGAQGRHGGRDVVDVVRGDLEGLDGVSAPDRVADDDGVGALREGCEASPVLVGGRQLGDGDDLGAQRRVADERRRDVARGATALGRPVGLVEAEVTVDELSDLGHDDPVRLDWAPSSHAASPGSKVLNLDQFSDL